MKRGNPGDLDLDEDERLMIRPAINLLREALKTEFIHDVLPLHSYSEELDRLVTFKCSLSRSARHPDIEADEKMADMLRKELDLPADRPCLWHFDNETANITFAVCLPISLHRQIRH